jgi:hypothetical protein
LWVVKITGVKRTMIAHFASSLSNVVVYYQAAKILAAAL